MCVHKDGTVKLHLGEAVFDVVQGTTFLHSEQLASMDDTKCAFLGQIPGRGSHSYTFQPNVSTFCGIW